MTRARNPEAGFTLVEALVAIVVLAVGLMAVSNLFVIAINSNVVANRGTAAAAIASQQLEQLKKVPFDQLVVGGSVDNDAGNFFREDVIPGVGGIHTRWQVTGTGDNQIVFIQVRSEGTGMARSVGRADFATFRSCTALNCPI
jgi:prepilin-type N-terminal cleavage/methylation domain-containing protein